MIGASINEPSCFPFLKVGMKARRVTLAGHFRLFVHYPVCASRHDGHNRGRPIGSTHTQLHATETRLKLSIAIRFQLACVRVINFCCSKDLTKFRRCSRFITFGMFSIRPAKSRAFRLGNETAPAGGGSRRLGPSFQCASRDRPAPASNAPSERPFPSSPAQTAV